MVDVEFEIDPNQDALKKPVKPVQKQVASVASPEFEFASAPLTAAQMKLSSGRPSDRFEDDQPFLQKVAGVTDQFNFPLMAGFLGQVVEGGFPVLTQMLSALPPGGIEQAKQESDTGTFGTNRLIEFAKGSEEAGKAGLDKRLSAVGDEFSEAINEFYEVPNPRSAIDSAARLVGQLLPIPLPTPKGVGPISKAIEKVLTNTSALSPFVRIQRGDEFYRMAKTAPGSKVARPGEDIPDLLQFEKVGGSFLNAGNVIRSTFGLAVGIPLHQGLSYAAGVPLVFDEERMKLSFPEGEAPETEAEGKAAFQKWLDDFSFISQAGAAEALDKNTVFELPSNVGVEFEIAPNLTDLDGHLADEETKARTVAASAAFAALAAAAAAALVKRRVSLHKAKPSRFAPQGMKPPTPRMQESISQSLHGSSVDHVTHLKAAMNGLRTVDPTSGDSVPVFSNRDIDQLIGQDRVDSHGRAIEAINSGDLGTFTIDAPAKLFDDVNRLDKNQQKLFGDGLLAMREYFVRQRATLNKIVNTPNHPLAAQAKTLLDVGHPQQIAQFLQVDAGILPEDFVSPGLYDNHYTGARGHAIPIDTRDLDLKIRMARNDPFVSDLMDRYGRITDGILKYLVERKVFRPDDPTGHNANPNFLRNLRNQVRVGGVNGQPLFVPGVDLTDPSDLRTMKGWLSEMSRIVGLGTDQGKGYLDLANFLPSSLDPGLGVTNPLNPVDAMGMYIGQMINFADEQVFQWNILSRMAGIDEDGNFIRKMRDNRGRLVPETSNDFATFIGMRELSKDPPDLGAIMNQYNPDPVLRQITGVGGNTDKTITQLTDPLKNMIMVRHLGREYIFYVPDDAVRGALSHQRPDLHIALQAARLFKNVKQITTTRLPFFAFKSFMFAMQQTQQNAIAKGLPYNPLDAVGGAYEIIATEWARETASMFVDAIERQSGLINTVFPGQTKQTIADMMTEKVKRSFLTAIQRGSGTLSSTVFHNTDNPKVTDLVGASASIYKDDPVGLMRLYRYYRAILKGLYEGPTLGAMKRQLPPRGELQAIHAADPARADAMVRMAAATGRDLSGDTRRFGSSPMVRAMMAVIPWSTPMMQSWNSIGAGLNAAKKNGRYDRALLSLSIPTFNAIAVAMGMYLLTTQQRANNLIIYFPTPGFVEGLVDEPNFWAAPISPEWSLFHTFGLEFFDMLTGASAGAREALLNELGTFGPNAKKLDGSDSSPAHVIAALIRIFDIAVPPPLEAAFAAAGFNLRIGPRIGEDGSISLGALHKLGSGERISAERGQSRYIDPAVDSKMEGVLSALLGAVGAGGTQVYNSFSLGNQESLERGFDLAGQELVDVVKRQVTYLNPLIDHVFRTSPNDEISSKVRLKLKGVERLRAHAARQRGGAARAGGRSPQLLEHLTPSLRASTDPIIILAAPLIDELNPVWSRHNADMTALRTESSTITNDPSLDTRKRSELINENNLQQKRVNARTLVELKNIEDKINALMSEQEVGQGKEFELDTFEDRTLPRN